MKTFASGRNERIVFQSLKDLGLPHGKVSLFHFFDVVNNYIIFAHILMTFPSDMLL